MKYFPGARVNHIVNKYLNVYLLRHFWLRKNVRETFTQFQTQNDAGNCRYRSSLLQLFCKKVFLENSQNSQENTCTRVSFNKVAGLRPGVFL